MRQSIHPHLNPRTSHSVTEPIDPAQVVFRRFDAHTLLYPMGYSSSTAAYRRSVVQRKGQRRLRQPRGSGSERADGSSVLCTVWLGVNRPVPEGPQGGSLQPARESSRHRWALCGLAPSPAAFELTHPAARRTLAGKVRSWPELLPPPEPLRSRPARLGRASFGEPIPASRPGTFSSQKASSISRFSSARKDVGRLSNFALV